MPVMTKDLAQTPEGAERVKAARGAAEARASVEGLKAKTWDQLSPAEKDGVLKAIAINFGIVAPDPAPSKK